MPDRACTRPIVCVGAAAAVISPALRFLLHEEEADGCMASEEGESGAGEARSQEAGVDSNNGHSVRLDAWQWRWQQCAQERRNNAFGKKIQRPRTVNNKWKM